jgi:hypothetical protein
VPAVASRKTHFVCVSLKIDSRPRRTPPRKPSAGSENAQTTKFGPQPPSAGRRSFSSSPSFSFPPSHTRRPTRRAGHAPAGSRASGRIPQNPIRMRFAKNRLTATQNPVPRGTYPALCTCALTCPAHCTRTRHRPCTRRLPRTCTCHLPCTFAGPVLYNTETPASKAERALNEVSAPSQEGYRYRVWNQGPVSSPPSEIYSASNISLIVTMFQQGAGAKNAKADRGIYTSMRTSGTTSRSRRCSIRTCIHASTHFYSPYFDVPTLRRPRRYVLPALPCTRRPPCTRTRGAPGSLQAVRPRGRKKTPPKKIAPPLRRPEPNGRTGRPLPCTGRGSPPPNRPAAPLGDPAAPVQPRARPGGFACQPPHPAKRHPSTYPAPAPGTYPAPAPSAPVRRQPRPPHPAKRHPSPTLHLHRAPVTTLRRAPSAPVAASRGLRIPQNVTRHLPCTCTRHLPCATPSRHAGKNADLPATRTGRLPCTYPAPAPAQGPSAAGPPRTADGSLGGQVGMAPSFLPCTSHRARTKTADRGPRFSKLVESPRKARRRASSRWEI